MISFICFIVFMILNVVNVFNTMRVGNECDIFLSAPYWIALICTCGCYLAGCINYIFKE